MQKFPVALTSAAKSFSDKMRRKVKKTRELSFFLTLHLAKFCRKMIQGIIVNRWEDYSCLELAIPVSMFLELTSKFTHFMSLLSSRQVFGGYYQVNTFLKRTSMTGIHTHGWRIFASICTYTNIYGAYITSKHKPQEDLIAIIYMYHVWSLLASTNIGIL